MRSGSPAGGGAADEDGAADQDGAADEDGAVDSDRAADEDGAVDSDRAAYSDRAVGANGYSDAAHRSSARRLARLATPWGFPVCYLGWAYLFWIPIVLSGDPVWSFPTVIPFVVGGLSPLIAGLFLLWLTAGRAGFADLWDRLVDVGRVGARWWLIILAFFPAFHLVAAAVALALGTTATPLEFVTTGRLFDPGSLVVLVTVALVVPVIEETGLRGYWFDRLQARWSALVSSLILGVVWAAWHVPLVFMTDYFAGTTFQPELWWWLPSIVLLAIIGTWIYNNTARSVLALIAFHFAGNLTGEVMGFSGAMYPFVHLGTAIVALVLVAKWGPESLRGRDTPRPIAKQGGFSS